MDIINKASTLAQAILLGSLLASGTVLASGPWRASEANTRGWQLMSPEERIEHQRQVRSFATLAECQAYQRRHHQLMEERARQQGKALPGSGRDICAHLLPDSAGR
jgi:hypothetical protein